MLIYQSLLLIVHLPFLSVHTNQLPSFCSTSARQAVVSISADWL